MTDLEQTLQQLADLFENMAVPYALMGGLAVRAYGIPRPTYDVDFTVALNRDRLPGLFQRAEQLGYTVPEAHTRGWVDQVAGMPLIKLKIYLQERSIDIDIFLAETAFQSQLLARRRQTKLNDFSAWIVSPEDLILLKLIAGRPRDIADIGDILFTQGRLDEDYMRSWAKRLGILAGLEKLMTEFSGEQ